MLRRPSTSAAHIHLSVVSPEVSFADLPAGKNDRIHSRIEKVSWVSDSLLIGGGNGKTEEEKSSHR